MPRYNPLVQAKRRAPFYVLCVFLVTISFAILSLLKLEPIAQNLVQDHNSNIDLQQLVNSTIDTPQDAKIEDKEKTSDWPQPARSLEVPPGELKLVRIGGTGGPVDNARDFLLDNLEEFLQVYKDRPDKTNTCGIRINHSLAIYTITKRLQPTTIVESGVNSGQSTYFFRKAAPNANIISIDPMDKPICGQPVRWIDDTNNEYLTGSNFVDFDQVNWGERIKSGAVNPSSTLVFVDDHRGFYKRFPTLMTFGFRHVINEDNYKIGEGATPQDKSGFTPKQMWEKPADPETQWLFQNSKIYAEFPPILPPVLSKSSPHPKKPQGGFLHHTDKLAAIEEPLLRPDINDSDKKVFERIGNELGLDLTMVESQSYQEFMGYCFICYMELVPIPPSLRNAWKLGADLKDKRTKS
ncbi:hypothetical protein ACHAWC_001289 [Mediolabrus comicus]